VHAATRHLREAWSRSFVPPDDARSTGPVACGARQLARAQRDLDGLVEQQRSGLVPQLAVVQQQTVVGGLAAMIPPLGQQLAQTKDALAILVGKLPEELQLMPGSLRELSLPKVARTAVGAPDPAPRRAGGGSANSSQPHADIKVARAQFFPPSH